MPTIETYELGARNLAKDVRETSDRLRKAKLITYLGNLRYTQYVETREPRARKLAANCYIAARSLSWGV